MYVQITFSSIIEQQKNPIESLKVDCTRPK